MYAVCFEACTNDFIHWLLHRVVVLGLHLSEQGDDFFNLPLFALAFIICLILGFLHGLLNLILEVVN